MSHSVSPKQLAANRANAARSTGPRTPQGKHRSAQNARKHGFTASTFAVVRLKDLQEVAHLKKDLVTVYQPVGSQELLALDRVALAQHAILRAARQSNSFSLLLRYQAQAERQYRRAIQEFERLKALREELPIEPIFEAQPEQTETTCTSCGANPSPGPWPLTPVPPQTAPASQTGADSRAVDYHVGVQPLEPIPGGPPCIEH